MASSEEKPRNLWKDVDQDTFQVKTIIVTINNYNIIESL